MDNNDNIETQKAWQYQQIVKELRDRSIEIVTADSNPNTKWGAYLRIADASYPQFVAHYWEGVPEVPQQDSKGHLLAPKILLVAPGMRLSLQYHNRRAEYWRIVNGPVRVVTGDNEESLHEHVYPTGGVVHLAVRQWHRLAGIDSWGIVAEIWDNIDRTHPSDELDIVRVQDDFGR